MLACGASGGQFQLPVPDRGNVFQTAVTRTEAALEWADTTEGSLTLFGVGLALRLTPAAIAGDVLSATVACYQAWKVLRRMRR